MKMRWCRAPGVAAALWLSVLGNGFAQRRPFTVEDDIGLAHFGDLYSGVGQSLAVSPDHSRMAAFVEYGSIQDNRLHDELRIYDMGELRKFLDDKPSQSPPSPIWTLQEATNSNGNNGTLISNLRWLDDSSGVAFLLRNGSGLRQLMLADIRQRSVIPLTAEARSVSSFEIRDRNHYVFTLLSEGESSHTVSMGAAETAAEGQTVFDLAFPEEMKRNAVDRNELWAAVGGEPFPVVAQKSGRTIVVYPEGVSSLALSPDGESLVAILPVENIPGEWEEKYPPSYDGFDSLIKTGHQDLSAPDGVFYVSQFVLVGLRSGTTEPLTDAPTAVRAGWWANRAVPAWSDDGKFITLPGTFVPQQTGPRARPCIAIREASRPGSLACLEPLKRNLAMGFEAGYEQITSASFAPGKNNIVIVKYQDAGASQKGQRLFSRDQSGSWKLIHEDQNVALPTFDFTVAVSMNFEDPPKLVATDTRSGRSRAVWDPNPQLKDLELGETSLYHWKDDTGREWNAILYEPVGYKSNTRYPLVIQNHGFSEARFSPSGGFPSAFVAQELAAAGIMVLHVRDCDGRGSLMEGSCNVKGYESAVAELSKEGHVDPERVGIVGFSRTVFYVMEALTTSELHFKAASITDGINVGYFQYVLSSGLEPDPWTEEYRALIGGSPIGQGLKLWMKNSPEFNLDKVHTPLRIVVRGREGSFDMWEPYGLLREMHKPAEYVILNTDEHVLTEPIVRLAAQEGNLDWFRFWLQGYEDPNPAKAEQYKRWEHLRELRDADAKTLTYALPAQSGGK